MSFSKFFSIILHPIFMPLITVKISLLLVPSIGFSIYSYINYINTILFISSIFFPLISTLYLIKRRRVDSLEMQNHKDRFLPLIYTLTFMFLGYMLLNNILIFSPIIKAELTGAILIILFATIISKFWKISLHMLGIGGLFGVIIGLNIIFGGLTKYIIIVLLVSGLLGVARVNEKAHNNTQVYVGFILGTMVELISILFFYNHINNLYFSL